MTVGQKVVNLGLKGLITRRSQVRILPPLVFNLSIHSNLAVDAFCLSGGGVIKM